MHAEERQQRVVERARRDGRVDVTELSADLAVTGETIRRDLSLLERRGLLRRVHGGLSSDHLCRLGELSDIDTFVTESGLDERAAAGIGSRGPKVVRV